MTKLRIYLDTSVFGGYFDAEFESATQALFRAANDGKFLITLSEITLFELEEAPSNVQDLLDQASDFDVIEQGPAIEELRDAYLEAGVVPAKCGADAEHIAAASVGRVDVIVSWNFKHIVHFDRIKGFHAVNLLQGYPLIPIHSPPEVLPDGY